MTISSSTVLATKAKCNGQAMAGNARNKPGRAAQVQAHSPGLQGTHCIQAVCREAFDKTLPLSSEVIHEKAAARNSAAKPAQLLSHFAAGRVLPCGSLPS